MQSAGGRASAAGTGSPLRIRAWRQAPAPRTGFTTTSSQSSVSKAAAIVSAVARSAQTVGIIGAPRPARSFR